MIFWNPSKKMQKTICKKIKEDNKKLLKDKKKKENQPNY